MRKMRTVIENALPWLDSHARDRREQRTERAVMEAASARVGALAVVGRLTSMLEKPPVVEAVADIENHIRNGGHRGTR